MFQVAGLFENFIDNYSNNSSKSDISSPSSNSDGRARVTGDLGETRLGRGHQKSGFWGLGLSEFRNHKRRPHKNNYRHHCYRQHNCRHHKKCTPAQHIEQLPVTPAQLHASNNATKQLQFLHARYHHLQ